MLMSYLKFGPLLLSIITLIGIVFACVFVWTCRTSLPEKSKGVNFYKVIGWNYINNASEKDRIGLLKVRKAARNLLISFLLFILVIGAMGILINLSRFE